MPVYLQTEAVVVHDAVQIFAAAMKEMERGPGVITQPLSCKQAGHWEYGMRIVEFMKMVRRRDSLIVPELWLNIVHTFLFLENRVRHHGPNNIQRNGTKDSLYAGNH